MSSRPACRASPVGADEKSSLNWRFSRLSPSRFMSYLPLRSFGPSATVPGSAYRLPPPFGPAAQEPSGPHYPQGRDRGYFSPPDAGECWSQFLSLQPSRPASPTRVEGRCITSLELCAAWLPPLSAAPVTAPHPSFQLRFCSDRSCWKG
jgi:hypothetical protein